MWVSLQMIRRAAAQRNSSWIMTTWQGRIEFFYLETQANKKRYGTKHKKRPVLYLHETPAYMSTHSRWWVHLSSLAQQNDQFTLLFAPLLTFSVHLPDIDPRLPTIFKLFSLPLAGAVAIGSGVTWSGGVQGWKWSVRLPAHMRPYIAVQFRSPFEIDQGI